MAVWNFRHASNECLEVTTNEAYCALVDIAILAIVSIVSFGLVLAE